MTNGVRIFFLLLIYALIGPAVGGPVFVITMNASFGNFSNMIFFPHTAQGWGLLIFLSYLSGIIPALIAGVYPAICILRKIIFRPVIYYFVATAFFLIGFFVKLVKVTHYDFKALIFGTSCLVVTALISAWLCRALTVWLVPKPDSTTLS